jgi:pimeloyl-ACP methyl ester carboxylesterase
MVQVDGHKLHIVKQGTEGPSVVFESGFDAGGHLPWFYVQQEVARYATTLSYDRAGILWSERGDSPKTCSSIAHELHELLEKAGLSKPYILVGHSLAGLILGCFVTDYSEEVAGIVFVDVTHPDLAKRIPDEAKALSIPMPGWRMKLAKNLGIARLFFDFAYPRTNVDDPINLQVQSNGIRSLSALYEEMEGLKTLLNQSAEIPNFGDIPLLVITGDAPDRSEGIWPNDDLHLEMDRIWHDLQVDLLKLSSHSRQILATKSGHYVQLEQPELVAAAIKSLLESSIENSSTTDGTQK